MEFSTRDLSIVPLPTSSDVLGEVLKQGAQQLLSKAIQAEVAEWIQDRSELRDGQGRQQVVRNGSLPERTILTGIGPIAIQQPRVRDRGRRHAGNADAAPTESGEGVSQRNPRRRSRQLQ